MNPEDARDLRRWLLCGMLVLGGHGAAVALMTRYVEAMPSGTPAAAIVIDLSSLVENPAEAPLTNAEEAPTPEEDVKPPDPPVEQAKVEDDIPETPKSDVAMLTPPPEPLHPPPEPKPRPKDVPVPRHTAPKPPTRVAALPTREGFPTPSVNPAARASWNSQIVSHIGRHKRYPPEAQSRREQGVSRVTFTLDRGGRVLSASLAGGSGVAALDQESVATVRRASPFPPPPPDVAGATFSFTLPIRYKAN